jgi:SPOR domain
MKTGWTALGIFLCVLLFSASAQAQQLSLKTQDSLVQALVKRHITINTARQTMPGFRVQIHFGSQRTDANSIRADFLQLFPQIPAYIIYHQPNFKIRVGDFKTRLEAMKLLKDLQPLYSTAFIVRDDVRLPALQ